MGLTCEMDLSQKNFLLREPKHPYGSCWNCAFTSASPLMAAIFDVEEAVRAAKGVDAHNSVSCEGVALLESFILAEKLKAKKVIFESDCADIVKWLNICPDDSIIHEEWFKNCLKFFNRHMEWKVFLIRREANVIADQLAKRVIDFNWC
ncbi:hypothetical protein QQ045_019790 [Rhodiola kirilowii]